MFAYLRGKIIYKSAASKKDNYAVLDIGGIGYKIFLGDKLLAELLPEQKGEFHIYTQVAENVFDLYGFKTRQELEFFELLLTVSGIGPRSALEILNKTKPEDLVQAVLSGDYLLWSKASGIGPKTAEKIVLGLKGKLGGVVAETGKYSGDFSDALEALLALGYSVADARNALNQTQSQEAGAKIKEALKLLNKK